MTEKWRASEEIAMAGVDGGNHKSGSIKPPGSIPLDRLVGEADIPMPLSIDMGEDVLTLSPCSRPDATTKYYKHKTIWSAVYNDGSILSEYDEAGRAISSESIDRRRLREFRLIDNRGRTIISQSISPGQCFFYRRRTALRTGQDVVEVMHIFGWRMRVGDGWLTHAVFLFESDMHVEIGDFKPSKFDLSDSKQWKYEPNWREIDETPAE